MNYLDNARRIILQESASLKTLADHLPLDLALVADYIALFKGKVILTGIGKSGYIARKIAASFTSTGTVATYLHPAEASHGDLGVIAPQDLVIILSNSGETKELTDIINYCKRFAIKMVAMTMKANSTLALNSDFLLQIPALAESSIISAPTTSALMMLCLGDALTICVQEAKGFTAEDFKLVHPGGKIGASLLKVGELMRQSAPLPLLAATTSFTEIVDIITEFKFGCGLVVDEQRKLLGIVTDGDLRRCLKINNFQAKNAEQLMQTNPHQVSPSCLASKAINILNNHLITVLPVTENNIIIGILHIHDLLKAGVS